MIQSKKDILVTASELGEYVYCKRAWWLKFMGKTDGNISEISRGIKIHRDLFRRIELLDRLKIFLLVLVIVSLLVFLLTMIFKIKL